MKGFDPSTKLKRVRSPIIIDQILNFKKGRSPMKIDYLLEKKKRQVIP
jgi:hypothetical protein